MPVYGLRPDDVVVDAAGNVQTGATLTLHASQADAQAAVSPLATVTTNAGRWSADVSAASVWVRTPNGAVYQILDVSSFVPANPALTVNYNTDGTVASTVENGVTTSFTYNADGTVATQTRAGVTRTFTYSNGNVTGAA